MVLKMGKTRQKTKSKYQRRLTDKIRRINKKYGIDVTEYLPSDMLNRKTFDSVKDYNNWKKQVDEFTNRYNSDFKVYETKKGVAYLGVEKKLLRENTLVAIEKAKTRQEEIKQKDVFALDGTNIGKVADVQKRFKQDDTDMVKTPHELDVEHMPSRNALKKRMDIMKERTTDDYYDKRLMTMRDNWFKLIRIAFGDAADELIETVEDMSLLDFESMYHQLSGFKFNYYDSKQGYTGAIADNEFISELTKQAKIYKDGGGDYDRDMINFR